MVAVSVAASLAMADPGGYGYGMGPGCAVAGGAAAGTTCPGAGPGQGMGTMRGGYGRGGGQGMALLTPEERTKYRDAMHEVTTIEECNAVIGERQQLIEKRAQEKGVVAPLGPRGNPCERMKAHGIFG
jgi:hypothetical protein